VFEVQEAKLDYYPIKSMLWPDVQKRMRKGTECLFVDIPDIAATHNLPKNHQYIGPLASQLAQGFDAGRKLIK